MTGKVSLKKYTHLIERFAKGAIAAPQFEEAYLRMFKNESETLPEEDFAVLNALFCDVDAYCEDPSLRDDDDLSGDQLMERARVALEALKKR